MRKKPEILNNLGLRIVALLLATLLWLLVTNINDPLTYMQVNNVPVKLVNTELITDNNEVYTVIDSTDVIPVVTVTAQRSVIDSLGQDNIVATADISDMTSLGTVEIHLSTNKYNNKIESIKGSSDNVRLSIEERKTSSFALGSVITGEVENGYMLGDVTLDQNQVRVSGPASKVSEIQNAVATVDVSGFTQSISTNADIHLYDADNNMVDTSNLTMNITTVKTNVAIYPIKQVGFTYTISGIPATGYMATGEIVTDPETLSIAGRPSIINTISAIDIPAELLNVDGLSEDLTTTVNISDYLPDGVVFADARYDGNVEVTVPIEPIVTKKVTMLTGNIALTNVPDGYTASIISESDENGTETNPNANQPISLEVQGLERDVADIGVVTLAPYVDVGDLLTGTITADKSGVYQANVVFTLPAEVKAASSVALRVRLTPSDNHEGTDNTTTDNATSDNATTGETASGDGQQNADQATTS